MSSREAQYWWMKAVVKGNQDLKGVPMRRSALVTISKYLRIVEAARDRSRTAAIDGMVVVYDNTAHTYSRCEP